MIKDRGFRRWMSKELKNLIFSKKKKAHLIYKKTGCLRDIISFLNSKLNAGGFLN